MADNEPTTQENPVADDRVSAEAHARIKGERDEARAKAEAAETALAAVNADVQLRDTAYEHFSGKQVRDPYGTALVAMRDVTLKDVPSDELTGKLDSWLEAQQQLWTGSTEPTPIEEMDEGVEQPPAPGFVPSPAHEGREPDLPELTIRSPEVQEMIANNDTDGLDKLHKEGRLKGRMPGRGFSSET